MKFTIKNSGENIVNLMRKIGYYLLDEGSFIRPLERSGYPRFHIYLKTEGKEITINLHLDQKRPVYEKARAHAGEYQGPVVEKEAQRIQQILK